VIYSKAFPHTRHAADEPAAITAMQRHLAEYARNDAGAAHVARNFNPREQADRLLNAYARLTE
jgi:hypothetical protein